MMNAQRVRRSVRPLRPSSELQCAARVHSAWMVASERFRHGGVVARLSSFGIRATSVGENLAYVAGRKLTVRGLINAWLRSPEHRANLLDRNFRRVGIGAASTRSGADLRHAVTFVTVDFAD
jgi:uncharacterized protein YkwD